MMHIQEVINSEEELSANKSMRSPFIYQDNINFDVTYSKKKLFRFKHTKSAASRIMNILEEYGFLTVHLLLEELDNSISDEVTRRHLKDLLEAGMIVKYQPFVIDPITGQRKNKIHFYGIAKSKEFKNASLLDMYNTLVENQFVIYTKKAFKDNNLFKLKKAIYSNNRIVPYRFDISIKKDLNSELVHLYCVSVRTTSESESAYLAQITLAMSLNAGLGFAVIVAVDDENTAFRCEKINAANKIPADVYYILDIDMLKEGGPLNNLFRIALLEKGYEKLFVALE